MTNEIWKPISKDLYYISSLIGDYEVSNKGRIRNTKTGKILTSNNGKYLLHCKELGYSYCGHCGDRATFLINNIVVATFENKSTFKKHIK